MPSPVAHLSMGLFLFYWLRGRVGTLWAALPFGAWLLAGAFLLFSIFPDFDAIGGILTGDMGRWHNQGSHSILAALTVCLAVSGLAGRFVPGIRFCQALALTLPAYGMHILMDTFCYGRGVKLLWPFTNARVPAPVEFFGGFHWSEGLFYRGHIYTLLEEGRFGFFLFLICLLDAVTRRRRGGSPG